jgi:hypothetical protein
MRPRYAAVLLLFPAILFAEPALRAPLQPARVQQMVRSSGLIFSGEVMKVEHLTNPGERAAAITCITFRVENAVRGVRRGQVLQIREWQGLWNAGERYQPGEHVMLFLYPKSKLGLTSPVGGPAIGRYRVDQSGQVLPKAPFVAPVKPTTIRNFTAIVQRIAKER